MNRVPFFVVVVQVLMNCGLNKKKKRSLLNIFKDTLQEARTVPLVAASRAILTVQTRLSSASRVKIKKKKKSASTTIVQNILMKHRDLATDAINRVKQKILTRYVMLSVVF